MSEQPQDDRTGRVSRVRWAILALIVVVSAVAYVLRVNLSIVGPRMVGELGLSELQLGAVLSAFGLGYALLQFPGGVFGDRVGPRRAVTLVLVATGALTVATGLMPPAGVLPPLLMVGALMVVRLLVGAVQAPVFPVMTGGMVSNWFPVSSWGLPNGLSTAGLSLGGAATGPLVVWLMSRLGWRASFLATAPIAFVLAAVWWLTTRDHPGQHPGVNRGERELIEAGRRPPEIAERERGAWKAALADRNVLLLTLSYVCMNYVFYLFFNWFFYYLVEVRGFPEAVAASLTAAQWVLGTVGGVLGGLLCDGAMRRFGSRVGCRVLPVAGMLAAAVLLALGAATRGPGLAVALLTACFGFVQLTDPAYWAATIAVSGRHASAATGVLNTGGNLPAVVGGLLVPLLARTFGWPWAIGSGALAALAAAGLWLLVRADRPLAVGAAQPATSS